MTLALAIRPGMAALLALCLPACIDVREECWIHADGSARAELRYDLPSQALQASGGAQRLSEQIDGFFNTHAELGRFSRRITESEGRTRVEISAEIDDVRKLSELTQAADPTEIPEQIRKFAGQVDTELDGRTLMVTRRISLPTALPVLQWASPAQLRGHKLVYILHLPQPATRSNAKESWNDGKSLLWEIPLEIAAKKPFSTQVSIPLPIPWIPLSLILILAIATIILWKKLRKRSNTPTPSHTP